MPKQREIDIELAGVSPTEAATRMKAETKAALMPSFSSPLRGRGEESLAGRVDEEGFVVSPNEFATKKIVVTARGSFEATETGTRVTGVIGIPPAIVWLLRLSWIASLGAVGVAGYELLTAGESAIFAAFLAGFVVLATMATGWNVHTAEAGIPKLAADVDNALLGRGREPTETMEVDVGLDERKRRQARRQRD